MVEPGPGTPLPSVSAVVVNFNGGERVLNCLRALDRQSVPLAAIIVVDNGSTDGSPDRIRAVLPRAEVIRLRENRGASVARNIGLERAGTELVLLADADIYLSEDCVARLFDALRAYDATVVCPRILLLPESDRVQCDGGAVHFVGTLILHNGYARVAGARAQAGPVGACGSGCLLVERKGVLEAGGFDAAIFFYFEDLEFCLRLRALGHRLVCEPAAIVHHDRDIGTPGLSFRGRGAYPRRRAHLTMRHRLFVMFVHYRLRTLVVLLPALLLYELAGFGMALARGWAGEWVRAWLWLLRNGRAIADRRRRMRAARLVPDRDLLIGGPLPFAPGFVRSRWAGAAIRVLSLVLNAYWIRARRWIG